MDPYINGLITSHGFQQIYEAQGDVSMQLIMPVTISSTFQVSLYRCKITIVLFLLYSGIGVAEAYQSKWQQMANSYTQSDVPPECNSCHGDSVNPILTMLAPSSVPFDANEIDLELSGINGASNVRNWQYESSEGDGQLLSDISNSTLRTINFDTNESEITIRSCLLNGRTVGMSGNANYGPFDVVWNCESKTV
ncbi:MAG: hypothetical protein ACJAZF_004396 [Granulosicoccus sp.]